MQSGLVGRGEMHPSVKSDASLTLGNGIQSRDVGFKRKAHREAVHREAVVQNSRSQPWEDAKHDLPRAKVGTARR